MQILLIFGFLLLESVNFQSVGAGGVHDMRHAVFQPAQAEGRGYSPWSKSRPYRAAELTPALCTWLYAEMKRCILCVEAGKCTRRFSVPEAVREQI